MTTDNPSRSRTKLLVTLVAGFACATSGHGQALIPGSELVVLETHEPRHRLPCTVTTIKPDLGFDFMFHTGYQVEVSLRELAGEANMLTVLFRVVPQDRPNHTTYMEQKLAVPAMEERGRGESKFDGIFELGEGKYHVDWLMRDQRGRICTSSWDLETRLNSKDSGLRQWVPQDLVQEPAQLFADEPQVIRVPGTSLPRLSIIVNLDPPDPSSVVLADRDLQGLEAALSRIGRDPRIDLYSIIVCSLETQQIVYKQENNSGIDLPAIGEAFKSSAPGRIDAKRLLSSNGPAQFVTDLVREQATKDPPDALIVLGPKVGREIRVSREALASLDTLSKPAFYLSYSSEPQPIIWRDPISSLIKRLRGFEYRINRPKDLFDAWSDVVLRITRARMVPLAAVPTSAVTY